MLFFVLSLIANTQFPICEAPGDQVQPDVCWDGEKFLVVWADERDEISGIYASQVQETGTTDESYLFYTSTYPLTRPRIASTTDTVFLTFFESSPLYYNGQMGFNLISPEGIPYWDSHGWIHEAWGPIIPVRCQDHFALLYTYGHDYQFEFPTWSEVALLSDGQLHTILEIPSIPGMAPPMSFVGHGVWNGERLLCTSSAGFKWLPDSLNQNPNQNDYFFPRDSGHLGADSFHQEVLALCAKDEYIGMIGYYYFDGIEMNTQYYFDLLDREGIPVNETPLCLYTNIGFSSYRSTSLAYGNGRFVSMYERREASPPNYFCSLWGTEIDTNVTLLKEGFLVGGPGEEKQPAICFGQDRFLLVWADNRSGDWDIYGMLLDSLEYSGVEEEELRIEPGIAVAQTVFRERLEIMLSPATTAGQAVEVRDITGRVVRTLHARDGEKTLVWDGRNDKGAVVGSGVYFVVTAEKIKKLGVKVVKL